MPRPLLAFFLTGACAAPLGACAKDSPSVASHNVHSEANAAEPTSAEPSPVKPSPPLAKVEEPFNHTRYPETAVTTSGTLGKAPGGLLSTSSGTSLPIESMWSEGAAVVVFYRGHW